MLFYISVVLIIMLIIIVGIRIFLLGSTIIKINAKYKKYNNLSEYTSIIYFISGLVFFIPAYNFFRAVNFQYSMVASVLLSAGIVYICTAFKRWDNTKNWYNKLSEYDNIIHYILGLGFLITAYSIFRAIDFKYDIVSSMLLWAGVVLICNGLKMGNTMFIKDKGLYHGAMIILWKNIREYRFYGEYLSIENKDRKVLKFKVQTDKIDFAKKLLSEKVL